MPEFSTEFWVGSALAVVLAGVGVAVAIAMDAKTKGEFIVVAGSFGGSALITIILIGAWQMSTPWGRSPRLVTSCIACALVFGLTTEAIRWGHRRHAKAIGKEKERVEAPNLPEN